ncbi:MAG TPA: DUF6585 family protein [Streptosporangiaceae bacterium]
MSYPSGGYPPRPAPAQPPAAPFQHAPQSGVPPYQGAPGYPGGGPMRDEHGDELPGQLMTLASAQHLGRLRRVHRPARNTGYLVLFCFLVLFPLVFMFGAAWPAGLILCAVMWPLAGIGLARSPVVVRRLARQRIYLYDQGFVHADGGGRFDVYRWDQISTVFQRIVSTRYNGIPAGTQYQYTVTRADGTTIKLKNFWQDVSELGGEINLRVSQTQLPAMLDALARGRNIEFGDIVVNATGVAGRRGSVPWSEISKVSVYNGQVSLQRAGKFLSLSSTPADKIPNLPLFLHLATTYQQRNAPAR